MVSHEKPLSDNVYIEVGLWKFGDDIIRYGMFKTGLVFGIIVLFVGVGIVPTVGNSKDATIVNLGNVTTIDNEEYGDYTSSQGAINNGNISAIYFLIGRISESGTTENGSIWFYSISVHWFSISKEHGFNYFHIGRNVWYHFYSRIYGIMTRKFVCGFLIFFE